MNAPSEILTQEEVASLTGHRARDAQVAWLDACHWPYILNAAGKPIVGRWYARLKLAGITPTERGLKKQSEEPNFAALEE
jgi:hypothetical protein